ISRHRAVHPEGEQQSADHGDDRTRPDEGAIDRCLDLRSSAPETPVESLHRDAGNHRCESAADPGDEREVVDEPPGAHASSGARNDESSGWRPGNPASTSCQCETSPSPSRQQRYTSLPSWIAGKSTRPSSKPRNRQPTCSNSCRQDSISPASRPASIRASRATSVSSVVAASCSSSNADTACRHWGCRVIRSSTIRETSGSVALALAGVKWRRSSLIAAPG